MSTPTTNAPNTTEPTPASGTGGNKKGKSKRTNSHHSNPLTAAAAPTANGTSTAVGSSTTAVVAPAVHAHSTPSPPSDAILNLLSRQIDHLESSSGVNPEDDKPTPEEISSINQHINTIRTRMMETATATPIEQVVTECLDMYRTEYQQRIILQRQLASVREKLVRSTNQKKSLESLCHGLQDKNKKLGDDLRVVSVEQAKAHAEMKAKFESSLGDIQTQLNKHGEDRMAQVKENEKLRENLAQVLKFDTAREEHHQHIVKTKELEVKLAEAKLAQHADLAAQEVAKGKVQAEKIEYLLNLETQLRAQLSGYATKFDEVQTTLTKSNELFASFKSEMEKTGKQLKKLELEKQSLEKKNSAASLQLIQQFEERKVELIELEKLKRQNQVLTNLCKQLQSKNGTAANTTNGEQVVEGSNKKEEETPATDSTTTA